jgi:acyl-CoA synthetase (AMP-forming)/AMP-acid ligase II
MELIQKERITMIHAVPPVVLFLANSPLVDKYDTSSVKFVLSGGKRQYILRRPEELICSKLAAPLGNELIEKCEKRLNVQVAGGYGMTEVGSAIRAILNQLMSFPSLTDNLRGIPRQRTLQERLGRQADRWLDWSDSRWRVTAPWSKLDTRVLQPS